MYEAQPSLAVRSQPHINPHEHAYVEIGRVIAYWPETDSVDIALLQGGTLDHVPIAHSAASRRYGMVQPQTITTGYGTATPTGQDDGFCVIAFVKGRTLTPVVIAFLPPDDSALFNRPAGSSITKDPNGPITVAYSDGAYELRAKGASLRMGSTTVLTTLDSTLDPGSATATQVELTNSAGAKITLAGPTPSVTATVGGNTLVLNASGFFLNGQKLTVSSGDVTITGGGTIALGGNTLTVSSGSPTISGGGTIALGGNTLTVGAGGATLAFGGRTLTVGAGNVTLNGAGILTLNGQTLSITSGGTLALGGNTLTVSSGNPTITGGGTLDLGGNTLTVSGGNPTISGGGTLALGGRTLTVGVGNVTLNGSGTIALNGSTLTINSSGTLNLNSQVFSVSSGGTLALGSNTLTVGSGGTLNLGTNTLTVGSGNVTINGAGTLALNSYTITAQHSGDIVMSAIGGTHISGTTSTGDRTSNGYVDFIINGVTHHMMTTA